MKSATPIESTASSALSKEDGVGGHTKADQYMVLRVGSDKYTIAKLELKKCSSFASDEFTS